jgi:hypothetical protein
MQKNRAMTAPEREYIIGRLDEWIASPCPQTVDEDAAIALMRLDADYWTPRRACEASIYVCRERTDRALSKEEIGRRERTRRARETLAWRRRERAMFEELAILRSRVAKRDLDATQMVEEIERLTSRIAELERELGEAELIIAESLAGEEREREKREMGFTESDEKALNDFLDEWIALRRLPGTERSYSQRMYELAYILMHHSHVAYGFLRQVLALPSMRNVRKHFKEVDDAEKVAITDLSQLEKVIHDHLVRHGVVEDGPVDIVDDADVAGDAEDAMSDEDDWEGDDPPEGIVTGKWIRCFWWTELVSVS